MEQRKSQVRSLIICLVSLGLIQGFLGINQNAEAQNQNKTIKLEAILNQEQTVPPVRTSAHGKVILALNADHSAFRFFLTVSEIVDITKAHIHVGLPGEKGPHIFTLSATSFTDPLMGTLKEADLVPQPEKGISTFKDAVNAILSGRAYVNVHTVALPAEAIRGQIKQK